MASKTPSFQPIPLSPGRASVLAADLLAWFEANKRPMPWRETRDPYRIWVSEVMLQQTQVATVIPYYDRFMRRFPSVEALASAPIDDVLKHWEGLGYYSRARNLQKAAREIVAGHQGIFPEDYDAIRALPGIGDYTAGAVASIAFDLPRPAVDGNVFRVLSRLFLVEDDIARPQSRKRFEDLTARLIPTGGARWFNQALMELGATVCTPRQAACASCPLAALCGAKAAGRVEELPVKSKKAPPRPVTFAVGLIADPLGRLLIIRRPTKGLLGGLWEFPTFELLAEVEPATGLALAWSERFGPGLAAVTPLVTVSHQFTHLSAVYRAFTAHPAAGAVLPGETDDRRWVHPEGLEAFAFPQAQLKILAALEAPRQLGLGLTDLA
ncbi:MAG TPA: A/G-specific adenine glycosylase [Pantanalinema sp.]